MGSRTGKDRYRIWQRPLSEADQEHRSGRLLGPAYSDGLALSAQGFDYCAGVVVPSAGAVVSPPVAGAGSAGAIGVVVDGVVSVGAAGSIGAAGSTGAGAVADGSVGVAGAAGVGLVGVVVAAGSELVAGAGVFGVSATGAKTK